MGEESSYDDVLNGSGSAETMGHASEARGRSDADVDPEDDLDVTFLDVEAEDDVPFPRIARDPVLREIGNTPLVPHPENEQIVCKMERENPTLSHKDRLGAGMILGLRQMGKLSEGQRVVEASSGNTAGGVALAANRLGHPCTIVMRETTSPVKQGFVKSLGAEVVTAPDVGHEEHFYYQKVARRYADEHDAVYLNQYERPLNRHVHYEWTGPELYDQIEGEGVTHVVGAVSTCGFMTGVAEYLKETEPAIRMVGVDGEESNVHRTFHDNELGRYDVDIEGLGQWRVTDVGNLAALDDVRTVPDSTAISRSKHESADNGLLMGLSSGAAMEVAQTITQENDDARVVAVVHDGAEQYFHEVEGW
ncbi:cysteine synthase family protein [Halomicroarcula limicola]|uniref:Cysteine synthase family protein n=1 Tax=Haloarcula limicola TaxID=1429915 RepID=A0A8J8CA59_9EURY|nr:cysteine synthase family protein [Halomicroarcula limicola]MBV0926155.1 cysteine synthase family protein [Halomicroarcula limicola]